MVYFDEKPKSNSAVAVEKLRELIFSGELGAGSSHLESELAEALGMSRTPIREAALMLEAQGLVEVRPRKGLRILPVSPEDMREIYDVLIELESLAAADAASANHPPEELEALVLAVNTMAAALEEDDRKLWAICDDAFHSELVRLGGNSRIQSTVAMLSDQVRRARAVTLYMRPPATLSSADHQAVLEAIQKGDAISARALHRNHRTMAKHLLLKLLETHHLNNL